MRERLAGKTLVPPSVPDSLRREYRPSTPITGLSADALVPLLTLKNALRNSELDPLRQKTWNNADAIKSRPSGLEDFEIRKRLDNTPTSWYGFYQLIDRPKSTLKTPCD
jgi:hypothetical protein